MTSLIKPFSVCVPDKNSNKKYSILKFPSSNNIDFASCSGNAKLERENNLKEFKSANDLDLMPKSGAGSEYGREQREEARRKKYGIRSRKYNPRDQPWVLKLGMGKTAKRFKGTKSGGLGENSSYFVLMNEGDNKFVAFPVEEWYDFIPQPKYKVLNAEQAEEEFNKRDKILNHFAIMVNQKMQSTKAEDVEIKKETGAKRGKRKNKLLVSEFDELSDDDDAEDDDDNDDKNDDDDNSNNKKGKSGKSKSKKSKKKGDDEDDVDDNKEADEDSDEIDEGQEMDYISGESSDDEGMYDEDDKRGKSETYKDGGVAEEEGLRKLCGSDDDDDEEEDRKKDEDDDDDLSFGDASKSKLNKSKDSNSNKSDSDSTSDSDEDPDRDGVLFDENGQETSNKEAEDFKLVLAGQLSTKDNISMRKRKTNEIINSIKKRRTDPPPPAPPSSSTSLASSSVASTSAQSSTSSSQPVAFSVPSGTNASGMENLITKYLQRKPMTVLSLMKKIRPKYQHMNNKLFEEFMGGVIHKMPLKKTVKNVETFLSLN